MMFSFVYRAISALFSIVLCRLPLRLNSRVFPSDLRSMALISILGIQPGSVKRASPSGFVSR